MINVAFYDTKPYDKIWFDKYSEKYGVKIKYFESKLSEETAVLARDCDCVCTFVNDDVGKATIDRLCFKNIKLIALRCAGYNNVNRYHGDLLKCLVQNNNDIPFDGEEGISIIYIEGQSNDDNDIERRERE